MSKQAIASETFEIGLGEGLKVKGRVRAIPDGVRKPVVVVAHGFRGFQDWAFWPEVAERLAGLGYYAVSFDFSRITAKEEGLDETQVAEASTVSQELSDLKALLGEIKHGGLPLREEADAGKVALLGHSRSGGSSIIHAGEHPESVSAVVVWNGGASPVNVSSDPDLTPVQRAVALDQEKNSERFNVTNHFVGLTQPALIVQGDADSQRLLDFVDRLKELAPGQKYVSIPGANHTFGVTHPYEGATEQLNAAFEETAAFLNEWSGKAV